MITFITGLPGNGKTLFALWYIKMKAEKEQREVYYHNIKDLSLPWTVFDPEKWMDLPHGSIIVIDEAQDIFPKRPNGASLPDFYTELAKHRHRGFDIYLITQHPSLVDNFVRQLGGQHFHSIRKFGLARSTVYEWSAVNAAPQNPTSQKNAISLKWAYPKEVYTYYKSAEVHTVKRAIPAKLILAVLFVLGVFGGGYLLLNSYQDRLKPKDSAGVPLVPGQQSAAASPAGPAKFDPVEDATRYVHMNTPRVVGLAHTAPKYDDITKPDRAPIPAMCVSMKNRCICYSQQATPLDVPYGMCVEFSRNGYFRDFDADGDRQAQQRTEASVAVMARVPDHPMPSSSSSSSSRVFSLANVEVGRLPERQSVSEPRERIAQVHNGSIYPK